MSRTAWEHVLLLMVAAMLDGLVSALRSHGVVWLDDVMPSTVAPVVAALIVAALGAVIPAIRSYGVGSGKHEEIK